MRFLHLSDLHLGKRVNDFSMLEEQEHILEQIIAITDSMRQEGKAPAGIIIAGDIYDRSVPPLQAVTLFDDFLYALRQRDLKVFMISGNHDSAERVAFGGRIMSEEGICISPVYNGTVEPVRLTDEDGEVDVFLLPFIRPSMVRAVLEGEAPAEETAEQDTEAVAAEQDAEAAPAEETAEQEEGSGKKGASSLSYTEAMAAAISRMPVDSAHRNILVTHQFVTGASRSDSEEIFVGGIDNVDAGVFAPFDYVALGHIHRPQYIGRGKAPGEPVIRYCGTPLKYSFSEEKDVKSVTVLDLGKKEEGMAPSEYVTITEIPLTPLHDMRSLRGRYDELTLRQNYENTEKEDYLHITLTDENDIPDALTRLRIIYPNIMKLDYDNARTRAEGIRGEAGEVRRRLPLELLDEFYERQNGCPMNEEQRDFARTVIEQLWEETT